MFRKIIIKNFRLLFIFLLFIIKITYASECPDKREECNECYEMTQYIESNFVYNSVLCISDNNGKLIGMYFRDNRYEEFLEKFPIIKNITLLELREPDVDKELMDFISILPNLEKIDFKEIGSLVIKDYSLKNLKNLKYIYIHDNASMTLKEIPKFIYTIPSLETLKIANQKISAIPDEISNLQNLETLIIDNEVEDISDKICDLKKLKNITIMDVDETANIKKRCDEKFTTSTTEITTTTKTISPTLPVSTNGECGKNTRCPKGTCCSKFGYCGNTEKHCLASNGCQSEFGKCINDMTTTTKKTTTKKTSKKTKSKKTTKKTKTKKTTKKTTTKKTTKKTSTKKTTKKTSTKKITKKTSTKKIITKKPCFN